MNYSVTAGGKRLRPLLMQETYRMFGGEGREVEPFMAAMAMIHTYSLVHDDLPAMDNDEYRRGRKTTHIVFGEDMGILAGDALLNYAYETAVKGVMAAKDKDSAVKALEILTKKAGITGMVGGQVVDVELTGKKPDKDQLDFIFRLKTGALLEASLMVGAALAGAGEKLAEELKNVELHEVKVPYLTNVTADYVTSTENIKELLARQVSSSVCWQQSVEKMIADGVDTFIEMGPGKTLSGFMRKISRNVTMYNIENMADFEKVVAAVKGE